MDTVLISELRQEIVDVCHQLAATGLVVGTAGNVSARSGELVAVTPSGLDYGELSAELVGVHHLDGTPVEALLQPTSELPMHLAIYASTEAGAVVHTHGAAATAVSLLVDELPPIHYYLAMFGGSVPVAPYATYGSPELAHNVVTALADRTGCLLANHGAVTIGQDLAGAFDLTRQLEWLCEVYLKARPAGEPRLLPRAEIERVVEKLAGYGQRRP